MLSLRLLYLLTSLPDLHRDKPLMLSSDLKGIVHSSESDQNQKKLVVIHGSK